MLHESSVDPNRHSAFGNLRPRTGLVKSAEGDSVVEFDYKHVWFGARRLSPELLLIESGIVPFAVYHGGQEIDAGHLEVDREENIIVPRGFDRCFREIVGHAVGALCTSHACVNDRWSFLADNGFHKRAALLAKKLGSGILYLGPGCRQH